MSALIKNNSSVKISDSVENFLLSEEDFLKACEKFQELNMVEHFVLKFYIYSMDHLKVFSVPDVEFWINHEFFLRDKLVVFDPNASKFVRKTDNFSIVLYHLKTLHYLMKNSEFTSAILLFSDLVKSASKRIFQRVKIEKTSHYEMSTKFDRLINNKEDFSFKKFSNEKRHFFDTVMNEVNETISRADMSTSEMTPTVPVLSMKSLFSEFLTLQKKDFKKFEKIKLKDLGIILAIYMDCLEKMEITNNGEKEFWIANARCVFDKILGPELERYNSDLEKHDFEMKQEFLFEIGDLRKIRILVGQPDFSSAMKQLYRLIKNYFGVKIRINKDAYHLFEKMIERMEKIDSLNCFNEEKNSVFGKIAKGVHAKLEKRLHRMPKIKMADTFEKYLYSFKKFTGVFKEFKRENIVKFFFAKCYIYCLNSLKVYDEDSKSKLETHTKNFLNDFICPTDNEGADHDEKQTRSVERLLLKFSKDFLNDECFMKSEEDLDNSDNNFSLWDLKILFFFMEKGYFKNAINLLWKIGKTMEIIIEIDRKEYNSIIASMLEFYRISIPNDTFIRVIKRNSFNLILEYIQKEIQKTEKDLLFVLY